jgi:predicted adenylyl cyclase CyaB
MIEVEVRGRIENFDKTLEHFRKKAKFVEEKDRFTMLFLRKGAKPHREDVENELIDLRIRITNKKPELVLKYGKMSGCEGRKEILIPIQAHDFEKAVEMLKLLEWNHGVTIATKSYIFMYKDIEFALVKTTGLNYFEAEQVVHEKEDANKIIEEIKEVCKDFHLNPIDKEDFFALLEELNNTQAQRNFDLSEQSFEEIKDRFKEYF